MAEQELLNAEDAAVLETHNLLGPITRNRRRLARSTAFSSEATSISSGDSGYSSEGSFNIPLSLVSKETIELIGFEDHQAQQIWHRWLDNQQDSNFRYTFLQVCVDAIECQPYDAAGREDDWEGTLRRLGVAQELIQTLLDPDLLDIRSTATAKYWVIEAIESRFKSFEKISKASEGRVESRRREASREQPSSSGDRIEPLVETVTTRPSTAPGETSLWKGISESRLERHNGRIVLESLISNRGPCDFRAHGGTSYYFAPDRGVAELYARMAARLNQMDEARIVKMSVPNNIIEDLQPLIINFGTTFKRIIYRSRGEVKLLTEEYKDLRYIHSTKLVIAPICKSHDTAIGRLGSWEDVSENHLMRLAPEDSPAKQYVFQTDEVQWKLMEVSRLEDFARGGGVSVSEAAL